MVNAEEDLWMRSSKISHLYVIGMLRLSFFISLNNALGAAISILESGVWRRVKKLRDSKIHLNPDKMEVMAVNKM